MNVFFKYLLDSVIGEVLFHAAFYSCVFKLYIHPIDNVYLLEQLTEH